MSYTALIRPVLEYGCQVYQVASQTNLNKLERVQLSSGRIITDLRSCCQKAIVLYEADLQPLSMRIRTNSVKYIAKYKVSDLLTELRNLFYSGQATRD
ncbi:hypothetical protein AVEN_67596-1 [Araneus ventricosus]|uniref:Uncharacterized protein n=1 Tax=Araneus ventricosus TaxID=182803 RepID=A0A4Y2HPN5_ARAVE|nr:hypothetical protein AVEN_67596-1 [Araneus ventricosus]